jgi:hypothetical protein
LGSHGNELKDSVSVGESYVIALIDYTVLTPLKVVGVTCAAIEDIKFRETYFAIGTKDGTGAAGSAHVAVGHIYALSNVNSTFE